MSQAQGTEEREMWYRRRVRALEDLLAHYRIGKQPPERLHRELELTAAHVDHNGNWRAAS